MLFERFAFKPSVVVIGDFRVEGKTRKKWQELTTSKRSV
jgi:hypothetical protein